MLRFLLLILSLFVMASSKSQYKDSASLIQYPVKNGMAYIIDYSGIGCSFGPYSGVYIEADTDSVFHARSGKVLNVFSLGNEEKVVMIEELPGEYFIYSDIRFTKLKKGDSLQKGDFIGLMNTDGNFRCYKMDVLLMKRKKYVSSENALELLRSLNDQLCPISAGKWL